MRCSRYVGNILCTTKVVCNKPSEELSKEFYLTTSSEDSILSKTRIHISPDNDDDIEHGIITYINEKWKEGSGGHMNGIFSQSIMNTDFDYHEKLGSVWARYSLKQI